MSLLILSPCIYLDRKSFSSSTHVVREMRTIPTSMKNDVSYKAMARSSVNSASRFIMSFSLSLSLSPPPSPWLSLPVSFSRSLPRCSPSLLVCLRVFVCKVCQYASFSCEPPPLSLSISLSLARCSPSLLVCLRVLCVGYANMLAFCVKALLYSSPFIFVYVYLHASTHAHRWHMQWRMTRDRRRLRLSTTQL